MSYGARVLLTTAVAALGVLGAFLGAGSGADALPTQSSSTSTTVHTYVPRPPLQNAVASTTESGESVPPTTAPPPPSPPPPPSSPFEAPPGSEQALGASPSSEPTASDAADAAALPVTKRSARPGQRVSASGAGCPPGAQVVLMIGDRAAGSVTADTNGDFSAPLKLPTLAPGRHKITATCGVVLSPPLEVFVSSRVETPASSTLAVMNFVILLGVVLLGRGRTSRKQGARGG